VKTATVAKGRAPNRAGWKHFLSRLQGSTVRVDLTCYESSLTGIAALERASRNLSDQDILGRSRELRARARSGEALSALRVPLFALAREASHRVLGQRPFDEQIVAALALDAGAVVEMLTGEGKTLAAVMPAALNAFTDRGAHILTFNDYLARRDAAWMGPVYRLLGLSVAHVHEGMPPAAKRAAYHADVTYATAKEAGFDHLRDLLATETADLVHRPFHFALVDEADSLMIDEARVPLVIAGAFEGEVSRAPRLAELVASLVPGVHYDTDEHGRDIEMTDAGIEHVEQLLECRGLHRLEHLTLLTELNCALHARVLLRRDVDYIVRNGRIEIVDEFTGRVVTDRHWPDGLQSAVEAKEGLERRPDGRILGSITLQRFLRGYPQLCGMTGTAQDSAGELHQTYGLDVVVIPTHRPIARIDREDVLCTHREAKDRAIVDAIRSAHATGRPVLVGTPTVTESESLAERLRGAGVPCVVLNAKNDAEEAPIVARAGAIGAVTIATNMAGRGTDIRLGGEDPAGAGDERTPSELEADRARVAALGGLYVVGTSRHESGRVDLQLRGRAGRQGDPGESRFFVSLEDELLVRYGIQSLIPPRYLPEKSDAPVESPVVRREVARAQRIIEGQNLDIRRTLAAYAAVVEEQHRQIVERRRQILAGESSWDVWEHAPERRAALMAAAGEPAVREAGRKVMLACIDRAWRDHLALCADLREGIHLVRLGGHDPLTRFTSEAIRAFSEIDEAVDAAVLAALANVRADGGALDLSDAGLKAPTSTWTYVVNDDPFRNRMAAMLTGPGGATVAIYSALMLMPLLIAWGLVETLFRRVTGRRADPYRK
jgi:preprotein translocase subunit SecA